MNRCSPPEARVTRRLYGLRVRRELSLPRDGNRFVCRVAEHIILAETVMIRMTRSFSNIVNGRYCFLVADIRGRG